MPFKEIVLERIRFMLAQRVTAGYMERIKVDVDMDWLLGDMVIRFEKELLGEIVGTQEHTVMVDVPSSWWQHLKEDHFPQWYVRRWPVLHKTRRVVIDLTTIGAFSDEMFQTPEKYRGKIVLPVYRVTDQREVDDV